jgi:hypothetical protein
MHLLVRNRVKDFDVWLTVYLSDSASREAAGLHAVNLYRIAEVQSGGGTRLRTDR